MLLPILLFKKIVFISGRKRKKNLGYKAEKRWADVKIRLATFLPIIFFFFFTSLQKFSFKDSSSELEQKLQIDSRACIFPCVLSSKSVRLQCLQRNIRDKGPSEFSANNWQQWRCDAILSRVFRFDRGSSERTGCMRSTSNGDFSREKD